MKVILLEDIANLGKAGDVVKVKDGYARNMLIPRQMADEATEKNMKSLEHRKAKIAQQQAEDLETAQKQAETIGELTVTIKSKAGDGGKLFGSVTSSDIADALHEQHKIFVDKRKIQLDAPLKNAGESTVSIKLFQDVTAEFKVNIEV